MKRWSVQPHTPFQPHEIKRQFSDFDRVSARLDNYRTLAPDVCEQYTLPMMSVPVRLPKIGKLGALPTRDVIEMPEEQEETPAGGRVLDSFE